MEFMKSRKEFLDGDEGLFDCGESLVCSISGGGGSSGSRQSSEGEAGVAGPDRAFAASQAFSALGASRPLIDQLLGNVPQLNLGPQGLTQGQGQLAGSLVNGAATNLFSKFSGSGAARGQLSPANTSGIIGSASERAAASVLPQLIQTSGANTMFNTQAGQQTNLAGITALQNLGSLFSGIAQGGSSQRSSGRSTASNFNFGVVS